MTLLLWLLLAHVIGDFYLQKTEWVEDRHRRHASSSGLFKHIVTHLLLTALALVAASMTTDLIGWFGFVVVLGIIVISHFIIDVIKSYAREGVLSLLLDQAAHLAIIVALWAWLSGYELPAWQSDHLILLLVYLLAARPASFVMAAFLQKQTDALQSSQGNTGLVEGGRLIGYIERWLIVSFVLLDQFMGVGFLLAAKSIFRFGDLRQPHEQRLTEYMLLGTLLSFSVAMALGGAARLVL
ncbi:DUF3307 domain-containing protein [Aliidiomarina sp. Khilg15.8]